MLWEEFKSTTLKQLNLAGQVPDTEFEFLSNVELPYAAGVCYVFWRGHGRYPNFTETIVLARMIRKFQGQSFNYRGAYGFTLSMDWKISEYEIPIPNSDGV